MKYVVTLVDGSRIECDDFAATFITRIVALQKKKAWRENVRTGFFKTESVSKEEVHDFKYLHVDQITSIDVID